jgi:hypothetical protein
MFQSNPIRNVLRKLLRIFLARLSKWALKKHQPKVVAVAGEGKTGIAREAIYQALKKGKTPVRRSVEAPDAEFVLPLIILGAKNYPHSYWGWIKVLTRAVGYLLLRPPYKHILILEIGYSNKEIFDYFWEITEPPVLVLCGQAPYLSPQQRPRKKIQIAEDEEELTPYLEAALEVVKSFRVSEKKAKEALENFSLPMARIQVFPAKAGGIVIDGTYQYFPPSSESLEEILEAFPGKKINITPNDLSNLKKLKVGEGEVGIVTGPKSKMWPAILKIAKTPWFSHT